MLSNLTPPSSSIHDCGNDLWQVDLDLPRTGFRHFISAWVIIGHESSVLVDPGPAASYETLSNTLKVLEVKRLDAVLLTHIHMDHAGATGLIVRDFPAPVICHPAGIPHLVNPTQLEETAKKVLGNLADDYGPITPVPAELLFPPGGVTIPGYTLQAIETPGHAPHHLCFLISDILFLGEVAGVQYPMEQRYLRPATPPPFRSAPYRASLGRVASISARLSCFGHYGIGNDPPRIAKVATDQLDLWIDTIKTAKPKKSEEEYFAELLAIDPLLSPFPQLPPDIQVRERFFILNSIRGIVSSPG